MQLENADLLNFVLQISKSNRNFIQLLLNHGRMSFSQLCSDILKVLYECYHNPVESEKFHSALNSFISYYLQFVSCENKKFNFIPKQHVSVFNNRDFFEAMFREFSRKSCKNVYSTALAQVEEPDSMNNVERLKLFINHNSLNIDFDHLRIIKNSKPFNVYANVKGTSSEDALILKNQIIKSKQIFTVNDFETFLSPLKEDYTKSSKGYVYKNKIAVDKSQLACTIEFLPENNFLNLSDDSDTHESNCTDDNYDPIYDNILSRDFGSLKNLSSDSETSLNGRVSNSDSEDSITFSDYVGNCMYGYGGKPVKSNNVQCCGILNSELDSEDSITFSDYVDKSMYGYRAKPVKSNNVQCCDILSSASDSEDCEIFDNSLGNKFFNVSISNINTWNEINSFDLNETSVRDSHEICDKNSSLIYQSHEQYLNKDFSFVSNSLSQGNIETYSVYFNGFINPCFEDDDIILENEFLKKVNDEWEHSMRNVSCEPREPKKVSFLPMPNLVTVKTFEPDDDGYHFGLHLLNQVRFKNRIEEFEQIIKPYLSEKHRTNIYKNFFYQ